MANDIVGDAQQIIADLRCELALRTAERDEALAQQTATSEVLQVINASLGELAPVFDAMLDKALSLCGASFGMLRTFDGESFHAVAMKGVPPALQEAWRGPTIPAPGGAQERLVRGERFLHFTDAREDEGYRSGHPTSRALVDLAGARTYLTVPLRQDERLLGSFAIYRQEVRPFSDKQIALLQNFAAQAVIAMENARLLTETQEALEQQTATAEVLQVINASPGDLTPVFDAMLEKALHLCEAVFGGMMVYDGEGFRTVALRGMSTDLAQNGVQRPSPGTGLGRIAAGERLVHIPDLAAEESYFSGDPLRVATVERLGARSCVWAALVKDDRLLGVLMIYRREVRPFSDKQIALLQNFAAQAVIAMENARLLGELRERTGDLEESLEYQTATSDVLKVISRSTFDLQPVLQALFETAARLCSADFGGLMTRDGEVYRAAAIIAISPDHEAFVRKRTFVPAPRGSIVERTAFECRIVHIPDVAADPEYPSARGAFIRTGTVLGVPLMREGEPIGVIALARQRVEPFTERQIELVRTFADQAVIAMENARLLGELRERTDEIAGWNRELEARVAAQLGELERTGKLRRFLAPQLADLIVAQGDESILESHRREIVVVFCDLRGFTAFAERAEPEEVMALLRDYHATLGPIVASFEGTLDHYSGDGVMVFFNDPLPTPDPAERAIAMASAMRAAMQARLQAWRRHGHALGFGVGISQGYATLGQIGFAERMDYTAIGTVCNLAARLCDEAKDGQILISRRVAVAVADSAKLEEIGDLSLKGLSQAVAVFNVV